MLHQFTSSRSPCIGSVIVMSLGRMTLWTSCSASKGLRGRFVLGLSVLLPGRAYASIDLRLWHCCSFCILLSGLPFVDLVLSIPLCAGDPWADGCCRETIWFAIHFALLSETSDLSDLRPFASDLIGSGNLKCGEINYFQCLGLAFAWEAQWFNTTLSS